MSHPNRTALPLAFLFATVPGIDTWETAEQFVPSAPAGIGAAGPLDGAWRIQDLRGAGVAENRTSLPFAVDSVLRFEDGVLVSIDGRSAAELEGAATRAALGIDTDFHSSSATADVSTWALGQSYGATAMFDAARVRVGMVAGTVTADTARARVLSSVETRGWDPTSGRDPSGQRSFEITLVRVDP